MIGPHEGKELDLMLAGRKRVAMFSDIIRSDYEIPEEIIPENAFGPHISSGTFTRISEDIIFHLTGDIHRYVLFSYPDDIWRAQAILWIKHDSLSGRKIDDQDDVIIGRLLGYTEADIQHFLEHQRSLDNC
jgi:hypothetical protein